MRVVKPTRAFRRDFRREMAGAHRNVLPRVLSTAVDLLAHDAPLPADFKEHALKGKWVQYRECHLRPDLLLIYRKSDEGVLMLVRLGAHASLFE